jgi:tRNA U55 pseudouridine synthase TruB
LRENPSVISERDDELRKFLSIEELQEAISLNCFEKNSNIKDLLTRCICAMLEQSKIANEITYDEERTVVYRGFKFAENSEVVFDIAEKAFFAATFTYLRKVHEEKYKEKYEKFLSVLKEFFVHNNLLGNVITSDEFQIYSEIYRKQSSNNKSEQMNRLLFLIENDKPTYIRELCQYIEEIDWDKV